MLRIRFRKENLEKNMKVGKKENRINKNIDPAIEDELRKRSMKDKEECQLGNEDKY